MLVVCLAASRFADFDFIQVLDSLVQGTPIAEERSQVSRALPTGSLDVRHLPPADLLVVYRVVEGAIVTQPEFALHCILVQGRRRAGPARRSITNGNHIRVEELMTTILLCTHCGQSVFQLFAIVGFVVDCDSVAHIPSSVL